MSWKRTSTPVHTFGIPYDYSSTIEAFTITYSQEGKNILSFSEDDVGTSVKIEGKTMVVSLSQEDTAKFSPGTATIEIKLWTKDKKSIISDEICTYVKQVKNERIFS